MMLSSVEARVLPAALEGLEARPTSAAGDLAVEGVEAR